RLRPRRAEPQHRRRAVRPRRVHGEGRRPVRGSHQRAPRARRHRPGRVPRRRARMRPVGRRLGLGAATVVLAIAGGVHSAAADAPSQQGWWSAAGPATPAMAAGVPSDGLLVQGGPSADSPNAFAGLSFTLADGATPGSLTLKLAPN